MIEEKWICFSINSETYAHNIGAVKEIMRYTEPAPCPGATEHVKGMLVVRGEMMTVISGRSLLALPEQLPNDQTCIISLETKDGLFGIIVDRVDEMLGFERNQITDTESKQHHSCIIGTVQHNQQLIIAIDFCDYCESLNEYS